RHGSSRDAGAPRVEGSAPRAARDLFCRPRSGESRLSSFRLDACFLHELAPGLILALDVLPELGWRHRVGLDAGLGELRDGFGIGERLDELAVQPLDDVLRHVRRTEVAVPVERFVARVAGFGDRGYVGHQSWTLQAGSRNRARFAGADLRD